MALKSKTKQYSSPLDLWITDVYKRLKIDEKLQHPDWKFFAPLLPSRAGVEAHKEILSDAFNGFYQWMGTPGKKKEGTIKKIEYFLKNFKYRPASTAELKSTEFSLFPQNIGDLLKMYINRETTTTVGALALNKAMRASTLGADTQGGPSPSRIRPDDGPDDDAEGQAAGTLTTGAFKPPLTQAAASNVTKLSIAATISVLKNLGLKWPNDLTNLVAREYVSVGRSENLESFNKYGVQDVEVVGVIAMARRVVEAVTRLRKAETRLRKADRTESREDSEIADAVLVDMTRRLTEYEV
jgi:hypothetical protein